MSLDMLKLELDRTQRVQWHDTKLAVNNWVPRFYPPMHMLLLLQPNYI